MTQQTLIHPEVSEWVKAFVAAVLAAGKDMKWTKLLHHFVQIGVHLPMGENCDCSEYRDGSLGWVHANHALHNREVRAAILAVPGAREGLRRALYRDVKGPAYGPDMPEFGRIVHRAYGEMLLDFLRDEPELAWFRDPPAPVPEGQLYQGTALQEQHLIQ